MSIQDETVGGVVLRRPFSVFSVRLAEVHTWQEMMTPPLLDRTLHCEHECFVFVHETR